MTQDPAFFTRAKFIKSCLEEKDFPKIYIHRDTFCPEVAFIGRSNSGKSSLINHLTQKKDLVYISSKPGKTQTINFFTIDDELLLVDLPGYGFAKIQKELKKTWSERLTTYLENRPQLHLIILLLDLRRELSEDDKQMIEWARFHKKKLLFILSKSDKISQSSRKNTEIKLVESIKDFMKSDDFDYLTYSVKDNNCRLPLKDIIFNSIKPS
jgi:GTP-binding protein